MGLGKIEKHYNLYKVLLETIQKFLDGAHGTMFPLYVPVGQWQIFKAPLCSKYCSMRDGKFVAFWKTCRTIGNNGASLCESFTLPRFRAS